MNPSTWNTQQLLSGLKRMAGTGEFDLETVQAARAFIKDVASRHNAKQETFVLQPDVPAPESEPETWADVLEGQVVRLAGYQGTFQRIETRRNGANAYCPQMSARYNIPDHWRVEAVVDKRTSHATTNE